MFYNVCSNYTYFYFYCQSKINLLRKHRKSSKHISLKLLILLDILRLFNNGYNMASNINHIVSIPLSCILIHMFSSFPVHLFSMQDFHSIKGIVLFAPVKNAKKLPQSPLQGFAVIKVLSVIIIR